MTSLVFSFLIIEVCHHAKVSFKKKKDFEYASLTIVDIMRIELVEESKKKKAQEEGAPMINFTSGDSDANQPTLMYVPGSISP